MSHREYVHPAFRPLLESICPPLGAGPLQPEPTPALDPKTLERAYRSLVSDIADQAPDDGFPPDVDLLPYAGPLKDDELAVVCQLHGQAVIDEFSIDPTLLARFLRREISTEELVTHLKQATERAVCEALRGSVLSELENRAEIAQEHQLEDYHDGGRITALERLEHDHATSRLLK